MEAHLLMAAVVTVGVIVVLSVFFYFVPFFLWLSAKCRAYTSRSSSSS